jgi:hypothetical protein
MPPIGLARQWRAVTFGGRSVVRSSSPDGRMRRPSWRGLRPDRTPAEARRQPAPTVPLWPRSKGAGHTRRPVGVGRSTPASIRTCTAGTATLVAIAAFTAGAAAESPQGTARRAANAGLTINQFKEALLQMYAHAGAPTTALAQAAA